jgi:crotonobetainyl-CoA:carnitine CoA-transferase CaiB-like acyl-CoA transferase
MSDFVMDYLYNGRVAHPTGNRSPHHAPQGCYPTAGDDMWMVLSVSDNDQWRRFCEATGHREWLQRPEFASPEMRQQNHHELDELIRDWSQGLDHWEASRILIDAGVPAAPVMPNWEILADPHVQARGFYVPVTHPQAGTLPYPGFPWKLSATPASVRLPAPCFAQHTEEVLSHIVGLQEPDIRAVRDRGLIDDVPQTPILRGTL